jgi:predicted nucleotide-binding protein (sugar kinase/HSP70/actin superfamily)
MNAASYQIGNSTIASNVFIRKIGLKPIVTPELNNEMIKQGLLLSPEFACFPFKALLGKVIEALKLKAKIILIPTPTNISACQSADFGYAQKFILKKYGFSFHIIPINSIDPRRIFNEIKKYNSKISFKQLTHASILFTQKLFLIEEIEEKYKLIFLSYNKKKAETFQKKWLKIIDEEDDFLKLRVIKNNFNIEFNNLKIINQNKLLKIGIIGDVYCINEKYLNNNLFERLYNYNIYADNGCKLSLFILNSKLNGFDIFLKNKAQKYLKHQIGGFSMHTIKQAITYSENKYDGIIHIYPFGCMPETVVRTILPKISKDYKIPMLHLPIDEQTGDAGFSTRIEAFVDLITLKKNKGEN